MNITFLGDIALIGQYIKLYNRRYDPFKKLNYKFESADYIVGNLESFAKGEKGENLLKAPRLTTTEATLNYLNNIRLEVACLANNHVYDHKEDGYNKTIDFLKENNIKSLGAGATAEEASTSIILKKNSISIGLLNYVTHDTNPNIPLNAAITPNYFNEEKVLSDIKILKPKVDHVILLLHWGGRVEGGLYPDYDQPMIARKLIDQGADLIIGHHSHTFQPYEVYKEKYIFYSLGNFCFSDYWFDGSYMPLPKRRRVTGILNIQFTKSNYEVELNFYHNNIKSFEKISEYPLHRQNWIFKNVLNHKSLWNIYFFQLKYIAPIIIFFCRDDISPKEKIYRFLKSLVKRVYNKCK